jgi:hypothetical protein
MPARDVVAVDGVRVTRVTSDTIWCEIRGRLVRVPRAQISGDGVQRVGEQGRLVVSAWFATQHKLVA